MELLTQYSLGLELKECVRTNNNEVLGSVMKTINDLKTIANHKLLQPMTLSRPLSLLPLRRIKKKKGLEMMQRYERQHLDTARSKTFNHVHQRKPKNE